MNKISFFIGWCCLLGQLSFAQTITPSRFNFSELAQTEKAHPELFKRCATCQENENDRGWKKLYKDLTIPAGATVKKQTTATQKTTAEARPATPATASPFPTNNFLGYIDPGLGIPPDTHGAIGPNHVLTVTNDYVIAHNKTTGQEISRVSITAFTGVSSSCDPYIQYDPNSGRFFYSAINCDGNNGNTMVILISSSGDPTAGWIKYSFVPGTDFFLDHPYLGFNEKWLVVSGRRFPTPTTLDGPILLVFDKATLAGGGPLNFGINAQKILKSFSSDGDAPLPVTVYGTNPSPGTFYVLQDWNGSFAAIRLTTLNGEIPNVSWNSSEAVFAVSGSVWNDNTGDVAEQLGETRKLSTNDARISTGMMVNGDLWCAHHVGISDDNVAIQWWQLDGHPGPNFGNVKQNGRIGDGLANNYRWFPGIAVNELGDVLIGYTVSSNVSRVSAAYSFRSISTPLNSTDDEYIYKLGLNTYFKDFGSGHGRWGDYSHSAVDPVDGSIWTIQEYADQRLGTQDNSSRYGVWWAQVTPSSTLLQTDASIGAVLEPSTGLICKIPIEPKISIRNLGTDTLKKVQIGMLLDSIPIGGLITVDQLSIPKFSSSAALSLKPSFTASPGSHVFQVYTIHPNDTTDLRPYNDTSSISFTVANTLDLPYTELFADPLFPPPNGSAISNPDGLIGGITWERTTLAGRPGPSSMTMRFFNYGPNFDGARDIYSTPKINSSVLDSIALSFNVAYQQYPDTSDSLNIVYSTDCGNSWQRTGYSKGGASLSTVSTTAAVSFVPTDATQWRTEKITLQNFCEKNISNLMIGFEAVNSFGNNLYVDSINIIGYQSFNRNAVLKSITSPPLSICGTGSFTPQVIVSNAGLDTIKQLKICYVLDNGPDTITTNWSGNLSRCDSIALSLGTGNTSVGTHLLTVFTASPNGLDDQASANDTLRKVFSIYNSTATNTPVFEGFEETNFPQNNWGTQKLNGGTGFERSTLAASSGSASMEMNNPNPANVYGALNYFITPIIANSNKFDSVFVDFDLAYQAGADYPGATTFPLDTLELLSSADCGTNLVSIWKKWGYNLQTVNDPNFTSTTAFVPTSGNDWKHVRLFLTPYIGSSNFQLYFASKGNKQNNLWIDNINISSLVLPQRLKDQGYLIYPIPFNNSFIIHHYATEPPVDLQSLQVYNTSGQLVWQKQFNGNAQRKITVNLGSRANGLYILKMIYTNKTVIERIIKN